MTTNDAGISRPHIPVLAPDAQRRLEGLEQAVARLQDRVKGLEDRLNGIMDRADDS